MSYAIKVMQNKQEEIIKTLKHVEATTVNEEGVELQRIIEGRLVEVENAINILTRLLT